MDKPTSTRREITPLHVPWLQHEQFPLTKVACSTEDGLVSSSKHSLIRVVQELKRGRANVDKQLSQLDTQLLSVSDYLEGKRSTIFPPHLIVYVEDVSEASESCADGRRQCSIGAATVAGKVNGFLKEESTPPTPAIVEEDLNSDTPCTTTGLWKYLYAYSFFKTITPEDMDQALLLDDLNALSEELESRRDENDDVLMGLDSQRLRGTFSLNKFTLHDLDDFFMERLVASLCVVGTPALMKEDGKGTPFQPDDEDKHPNGTTEIVTDMETNHPLRSIELRSWKSKGLTRVLCNIGLVEGDDKEIARVCLSNPTDDEVSQEIRSLERQLQTCVRGTNETKRKLRQMMDETKPWLSQEKEKEEAIVKKYFTMWHTNRELARKKKLREKKLRRRQALCLNDGSSGGKSLMDEINVK